MSTGRGRVDCGMGGIVQGVVRRGRSHGRDHGGRSQGADDGGWSQGATLSRSIRAKFPWCNQWRNEPGA